MKKVYICSPYAGEVEKNTINARKYCRFALLHRYRIPFAPHLYYPQFLEESVDHERRIGLKTGLEDLRDCEEVWVFGSFISNGMSEEIKKARKLGMPIRLFDENCIEIDKRKE